jgi:pilus assembly protein CpaC
MRPSAVYPAQFSNHTRYRQRLLTWAVAPLLLVGPAHAQDPERGTLLPPIALPKARPADLPSRNARPLRDVLSFVDPPTANDAVFELFVGQSRILPLKAELRDRASVAAGDPSVVDFNILSARQLRLVGQRIGVTDLSIVAGDQVYSFEIRVTADLEPLRLELRAAFPDAQLQLAPIRDHIVVEGQARDAVQVARIVDTIKAYLDSVYTTELRKIRQAQPIGTLPPGGTPSPGALLPPPSLSSGPNQGQAAGGPPSAVSPEQAPPALIEAAILRPQVINLIRVPGPQQVLLKVRIAELNRTALREIGANFLAVDHDTGTIVGTQIGGSNVSAAAGVLSFLTGGVAPLASQVTNSTAPHTTIFGIFDKGDFDIMINALRQNALLKILAEPNLIALNGAHANFLAGGKFPVPIPQTTTGGVGTTVTVQFEPFGVELEFVPFIQVDETIRLTVHPSVSSIDPTLGTVLVPGGTPVPGLNSREAQTTVELHQGQTLAIAGLLQLTLSGQTTRIPGLGDLPIIGPFFSNTTGQRMEKELIVLVTPYLVEPMNPDQVPPSPGDEVKEPNDLEFYFLNRIEGRTGRDFRSTVQYDDAAHVLRCLLRLEKTHVCGPHGYCD